jgi:predicted CXXCH cytochrome family protein
MTSVPVVRRRVGAVFASRVCLVAGLASVLGALPHPAAAQTAVRNTKHNLSAMSANPVRATSQTEICEFCHVPHQARIDAPLWNRNSSVATYRPYTSPSLQGSVGQPNGNSKLCLSCHDGSIANGAVLVVPGTGAAGTIAMTGTGAGGVMPAGTSLTGTNLTADHPVSFVFDQTVRINDGELVDPSTLSATALKLMEGATAGVNNTLQCSTCHDPHTDALPHFLRITPRGRAGNLCVTCHIKPGWSLSTHESSMASVTIGGTAAAVSAHSCMSCHAPHTDDGAQRLLRAGATAGVSTIENTCYQCHKTAGVGQNIQAEFAKTSKHPVANATYAGRHNPVFITQPPTGLPENVLLRPGVPAPDARYTDQMHVECVDCHNPHRDTKANMLEGMRGISLTGAILSNVLNDSSAAGSSTQYAVCLRCHGDSYLTALPTTLASGLTPKNKRTEFQSTNSAQHGVGSVGRNNSSNLNAQLSPYGLSVNAVLKCTDCHNSNSYSGTGRVARVAGTPSGPHGSTNTRILRANYRNTWGVTTFSAANFTLCFQCHSQTVLMGSASTTTTNFVGGGVNLHYEHLVGWIGATGAICASCHYNIHSNQETTTTQYNINNVIYTTPPPGTPTRLVNFSPNNVRVGTLTRPQWWYNSTTRERRCYVTCHSATGANGGGKQHNFMTYTPAAAGDLR